MCSPYSVKMRQSMKLDTSGGSGREGVGRVLNIEILLMVDWFALMCYFFLES